MRGLPLLPVVRQLAAGTGASSSASTRTAVAIAKAVGAIRAASSTALETAKLVRKRKQSANVFEEGHGEQIWVFNHISTNQVVYAHKPTFKKNRVLKQLPFNGRKTVPIKIRKDYWQPLALVQFEKGAGDIGRSAFQKLREFRREHELTWGHQKQELLNLHEKLQQSREVSRLPERDQRLLEKRALGAALSDQRANSIADLAAVLGGKGRGNLVRPKRYDNKAVTDDKASGDAEAAAPSTKVSPTEPAKDEVLAPVTVFWANEYDRNLAETWSKNVLHVAGIPEVASSKADLIEDDRI